MSSQDKVEQLRNLVKMPFLVLAPMDDVTDTVFRQIINGCTEPDMSFTEFVNVDGLMSEGREHLLKKVRFMPSEKRLFLQLWGKDPANFKAVAEQVVDGSLAKELGLPKGCNFAGIDLNMGCPAKSEVKNGTCSALILNRPLAGEIIAATREGLKNHFPISVKTRLGFSSVDMTWIEFLLSQKLNMLTIHGRTRKEMSKVPVHYDLIGDAVKLRNSLAPSTLIVGNGDILTRAQGIELAEQYKLDGIMIGRGVFRDPFVFAKNSPWAEIEPKDKVALYKKHVELFAETWRNHERPIHTLNKFCKIYVNGFDGAREMRDKLMRAESTDELLNLLTT